MSCTKVWTSVAYTAGFFFVCSRCVSDIDFCKMTEIVGAPRESRPRKKSFDERKSNVINPKLSAVERSHSAVMPVRESFVD